MRVLQLGKFFPPFKGGIESHVEMLCDRLSQHLAVHVIAFAHDRDGDAGQGKPYPVTRVAVDGRIANGPISWEMVRHVREQARRADIIHIHQPNPMADLAVLASKSEARLVITYHGDIVKGKVLECAMRPLLESSWRRASAILVNSEHYVGDGQALVRYRQRLNIVPLGIDLSQFEGDHARSVQSIRAQFGGPIVLGVGRMVEFKGFRYLIEAMRDVEGRLLLLGEGPIRKELERHAQRLGVEHKVSFLGNVHNPAAFFHACDLFVLGRVKSRV